MRLFIIPLILVALTQGVKLVMEALNGSFDWRHLNSYGGMPSSHSAFVASLATAVYYYESINSAAFAIAIVLLVIVIRDAMGYRFQLGIHGKILNRIIKELPYRTEYQFPELSERLGHTPAEVAVGIAVGIFGTWLLITLWP